MPILFSLKNLECVENRGSVFSADQTLSQCKARHNCDKEVCPLARLFPLGAAGGAAHAKPDSLSLPQVMLQRPAPGR